MLCMNSYPKAYIDQCRSKMESQLAAHKGLVSAAGRKRDTAVQSALASFEPLFFNNLVFVLDGSFVHRSRTLEGKDGNALNEVRMICSSLLQGGGVMTADKSIKFDPAKSILKLRIGDEIKLSEADFVVLSRAFFAELEARFSSSPRAKAR
jgi:hypothetical protein